MSDKMFSNPGIIFPKLIPVIKEVVSSAQLEKLTFLFTIKRSQIYITNRRGPRTDPCRTPYILLSNSLNDEPTLVVCGRFFRYEINTFNEVSSKPKALTLAIKSSWEM